MTFWAELKRRSPNLTRKRLQKRFDKKLVNRTIAGAEKGSWFSRALLTGICIESGLWFGIRFRVPARMLLALYRHKRLTYFWLGHYSESSPAPRTVHVQACYLRNAVGRDAIISIGRSGYEITPIGIAAVDEAFNAMRVALGCTE